MNNMGVHTCNQVKYETRIPRTALGSEGAKEPAANASTAEGTLSKKRGNDQESPRATFIVVHAYELMLPFSFFFFLFFG